jgi:hypothetical protein
MPEQFSLPSPTPKINVLCQINTEGLYKLMQKNHLSNVSTLLSQNIQQYKNFLTILKALYEKLTGDIILSDEE